MAKEYKCSDKRLVDYFEESRNNWKARASAYQREKRQKDTKIRDLLRSGEKWKTECIQLRKENAELKKKQKKTRELIQMLLNE
jgi:hypothetical protein